MNDETSPPARYTVLTGDELIAEISKDPERKALLYAGMAAGELMKICMEIDEAEIHRHLRDADNGLTKRQRNMLILALAAKAAMQDGADVVVIAKLPNGNAWIICPVCGWQSHSYRDAEQLYCGHCHDFHLYPKT